MTACKNCKHLIITDRNPDAPITTWYNLTCGVSPLDDEFNPYEGEFVERGYSHCRSVNDGDCQKFEINRKK